jgi:ribosomal protein S18 acetylase RimI-like enzyme
MPVTIRPMTPDDVTAAAEMVLRGDWGDRRSFFEWATRHPEAHPFVAEQDGGVVATAVGTANGHAGWLGAVFVDAEHRGRGVGRAVTEEALRSLEADGCSSLILVATTAGRPLYEAIGFRFDTAYQTIEADGLAASHVDPVHREPLVGWRPTDLGEMGALDREATGEDRAHLLRAFATPVSARLLRGRSGTVEGFVVRAPWGGGATVARTRDDALRILQARRASAGPNRRVRAGILEPNIGALAWLEPLGWRPIWRAPRLIRGEPLEWRPERLWGQFNHAIG